MDEGGYLKQLAMGGRIGDMAQKISDYDKAIALHNEIRDITVAERDIIMKEFELLQRDNNALPLKFDFHYQEQPEYWELQSKLRALAFKKKLIEYTNTLNSIEKTMAAQKAERDRLQEDLNKEAASKIQEVVKNE